jgi:type II secretory pathway component PulK
VLIITLWVMVMLSVMVTTLAYQVRVEASVERWSLNQSRLRWVARGGVHMAGALLREHAGDDYHSPYDDWWENEALWKELTLGDASV